MSFQGCSGLFYETGWPCVYNHLFLGKRAEAHCVPCAVWGHRGASDNPAHPVRERCHTHVAEQAGRM